MKIDKAVEELHEIFKETGCTLAVSESCTGGMIGKEITARPGSSQFFVGGVIAYSNDVKNSVLQVDEGILEEHGAVSAEVAEEMAHGARTRLNADIALSVTGVAGPSGGTPEKPVGLVFTGVSAGDDFIVTRRQYSGDRASIRQASTSDVIEQTIEFSNRYLK